MDSPSSNAIQDWRDPRLDVMLHEYDALRSEVRVILTLYYTVGSMIVAVVGASFVVAFQLGHREVLLALPVVGFALGMILNFLYDATLSLGVYLSLLEERINGLFPQGEAPILAWESIAVPLAWGRPEAPAGFGKVLVGSIIGAGVALLTLVMVLGSQFICSHGLSHWKEACYIAAYVFVSASLWLFLIRTAIEESRRLGRLDEMLRKSFAPVQPIPEAMNDEPGRCASRGLRSESRWRRAVRFLRLSQPSPSVGPKTGNRGEHR